MDTYSSREKQNKLLKLVLEFYDQGRRGLENGVYLREIEQMPIRDRIARAKYVTEEELGKIDEVHSDLVRDMDTMIEKGGIANA